MQTFFCDCGNRLFFDNSQCLKCASDVGFSLRNKRFMRLNDATSPPTCQNYGKGLCNWLLDDEQPSGLCLACRLNVEAPSDAESGGLLGNVEKAKRRLIFTLVDQGLPVVPKSERADGLGFSLRRGTPDAPVITGHSDGLITLDLNEADPAKRAEIQRALGEDYRTLLGHFRHEVGHYYWTLFFAEEQAKDEFRSVFGDERADYAKALSRHYAAPNTSYQDTHISSYATAHPWEDWAETWAHYLHILDSWETAVSFGLRTATTVASARTSFDHLLDAWSELMIALNSMNRSMGHDDAYPFSIAPLVQDKLRYVHRVVGSQVSELALQFAASTPSTSDRSASTPNAADQAAAIAPDLDSPRAPRVPPTTAQQTTAQQTTAQLSPQP